jgi:hypothetical protein
MAVGPERDVAVDTYASTLVRADPEGAAQWVEQVRDPVQRTRTAAGVFYAWSKENPAVARAWFRSLSGMDEGEFPSYLRNIR